MKKVVTYQAPNGETIDICQDCEAKLADNWPRNNRGEEFCSVSHGLHDGDCDTCNNENDSWDKEYECPRCAETLTPEYVEYKSWGRSCPKCGLEGHPAFDALDRLCEE